MSGHPGRYWIIRHPQSQGAVVADEAQLGQRWSPQDPQVGFEFVANQDITLHVSLSGSDSNDGSQSSPVKTINEALSRVPKYLIGGRSVKIYLDYGDYTSQSGPNIIGHVTDSADSHLRIIGHDSSNPFYNAANSRTDITTNGGFTAGCVGYDGSGFLVEGMQIDGRYQVFGSSINFEDCEFITGSGNDNAAISGYDYMVFCENCLFKDVGRAANASQGAQLAFNNCDGQNISSRPYAAVHGSTIAVRDSDGIENAASGNPNADEGSQIWGGPSFPRFGTGVSINIPEINKGPIFVGSFKGSSDDGKLDSALARANTGQEIVLERNSTYSDSRTITQTLKITGQQRTKTEITGDWTVSAILDLQDVFLGDMTLKISSARTSVQNIYAVGATTIDVDVDNCRIVGVRNGTINIDANAGGGVVDNCYEGTTVNNNGSYTVGDIA